MVELYKIRSSYNKMEYISNINTTIKNSSQLEVLWISKRICVHLVQTHCLGEIWVAKQSSRITIGELLVSLVLGLESYNMTSPAWQKNVCKIFKKKLLPSKNGGILVIFLIQCQKIKPHEDLFSVCRSVCLLSDKLIILIWSFLMLLMHLSLKLVPYNPSIH